jgi:hypothetical protein
MKKIFMLLIGGAFIVSSCVPDDETFSATSFDKAATVAVPGNAAFIKDVSTRIDIPVGLAGKSQAADIQSVKMFVHFVPVDEDDSGVDGTEILTVTTYPSTASITLEQLYDLADVSGDDELNPGDAWIVKYKVVLSDGRNLSPVETTTIAFTCASDLGGEIDYVTTNITATGTGGNAAACGTGVSGTATFDDQGGGVYEVSDISFGQYDCAWADAPASGVSLVDVCGSLSLIGTDQYGLVYSISIVSNDGTDLVIDWENDGGDSGRTTLTKKDGSEWSLNLTTE